MQDAPRPPVLIAGGLHSEARRTVVEALLRTVAGSAALHHELSRAGEGTVLRQVRDASGELSRGDAPLVNDCACCALREDLMPELERLADGGLPRLAVVELWDSVEPKAVAEVAAAQHPACALLPQDADEAGVTPFVWRRHRPFHPERLYEALEDLCCAAARSRGRFWLANRPDTLASWDAAGSLLAPVT